MDMNKDEILRKSREQKEDEGVIHAENAGRRYGFIGLSITLAAYMILFAFWGRKFLHSNEFLVCVYWC